MCVCLYVQMHMYVSCRHMIPSLPLPFLLLRQLHTLHAHTGLAPWTRHDPFGIAHCPSVSHTVQRFHCRLLCDCRLLITACVFYFLPPKGGRGCLMFSSCLESQGCHLIPLSYLLSCFFFFLPSSLAVSVF